MLRNPHYDFHDAMPRGGSFFFFGIPTASVTRSISRCPAAGCRGFFLLVGGV